MLNVLIAEDDVASAKILCEYLQFHGFDCVMENESKKVTGRINHETDAVILDINLDSGPSGLELLPEIKRANPDITALVITGDRISENRAKSLELGADFFFPKPLNIRLLVAQLQRSAELKGETQS